MEAVETGVDKDSVLGNCSVSLETQAQCGRLFKAMFVLHAVITCCKTFRFTVGLFFLIE